MIKLSKINIFKDNYYYFSLSFICKYILFSTLFLMILGYVNIVYADNNTILGVVDKPNSSIVNSTKAVTSNSVVVSSTNANCKKCEPVPSSKINTVNTKPKKTINKSRNKTYVSKSSKSYYFADSTFDFVFNGDVADIVVQLQQYEPKLKILNNLGSKKAYNINIDLQNTNITAIQHFVEQATNARAKLQYNQAQNSVRIIYDTKITVAQDAIRQSRIWQDGGTPLPILSKDGLVLFPFGQYEPKITCQPLQLCDIQLQAGEQVNDIRIGDSVRWNNSDGSIPIAYSGDKLSLIPHIVLKPVVSGLQTTLLITTQRRTYYIKLLSSDTAHVSRVGFYYPDEQLAKVEQQRQANAELDNKILSDDDLAINPQDMYFNYEIDGDNDLAFYPVQVFDDGVHTYIQMPTTISSRELPAFWILASDEETLQLVNFRYKSPYYIIDKLFNTGVMALGLDDNEQKITITRIEKKGFWARLFD